MERYLVQFLCLGCCLVSAGNEVVRIETTEDFDYVYLRDYGVDLTDLTSIQFTLKATNDGHVALSNRYNYWKSDSYEIVLGGWHNQKSAIRQCNQCNAKVTHDHRPLNASEYRPFWISWEGGLLQVGSGSTLFENEFMRWLDPQPHVVNYIGISTGWDANGTWVFGFIDGEWSEWGTWSSCNRTCGGGWRFRIRDCDDPAPEFGQDCVGVSAHEEMCETQECPIDGGWSPWAAWSSCSKTCDRGTRIRERYCVEPPPQFDGEECDGHDAETVGCIERDCPVRGGWTEWSEWEPCSETCDVGTQTKRRNCTNPAPMFGGENCVGVGTDVRQCFLVGCPENGTWASWGEWGNCDVTCGPGKELRVRTCTDPPPRDGGEDCPGPESDLRPCDASECPVDGGWSDWDPWSACSETCGGGQRMRSRACDKPLTAFGGSFCPGHGIQYETCQDQECPVDGQWSGWSPWGTCSLTCGPGVQIKTRACAVPPPQHGGHECPGAATDEQECELNQCPVDGAWNAWSQWSRCSVTCELGVRFRDRACNSPSPAYGGATCPENGVQYDNCQLGGCPVDGGWSEWSTWGACSMTCGHGNQERTRACDNPQPMSNGQNCTGVTTELQECEIAQCPVDGIWSDWGTWSVCSRSCEAGNQFRTRLCDSPLPEHGGDYCPGEEKELGDCSKQPCPIDGSWSEWSDWTSCTVNCGDGSTTRRRTCNNPTPANGGANCTDVDMQQDYCKLKECSVDGGWSAWTMWSECSFACGPGLTNRRRFCDNPRPAFGGIDCGGEDIETVACLVVECPVDGGWSEWGNWSQCSRTCDEGYSTRYRYCSDPPPTHGGSNCTGEFTETVTCLDGPCSIDGSWTSWATWSDCSASCGYGRKSRERNCSDPAPQATGRWCEGPRLQTATCKDAFCPIDGGWGSWTLWSICTKTCDGGSRYRLRDCLEPQPQFGGQECPGSAEQNVTCNYAACPVPEEEKVEEQPTEAPGAAGIGAIGIGMMCAMLGMVIVLDLATIHRHFRFMKRNLEHFWQKGSIKRKPRPSKRKSTRRYKHRERVDSENNLEEGFENHTYTPTAPPTDDDYYNNGNNQPNRRLPRHSVDEEGTFMNISNNLNTENGSKDFDNKGLDYLELSSTRL